MRNGLRKLLHMPNLSQSLHSQKNPTTPSKKQNQKQINKTTVRRKERQHSASLNSPAFKLMLEMMVPPGAFGSYICSAYLTKPVTSACKDLDSALTNFLQLNNVSKASSIHCSSEQGVERTQKRGHRNRTKQKSFLVFKQKNINIFTAFGGSN